eukprot:1151095-Pelagomonas_calceolata.AAC.1
MAFLHKSASSQLTTFLHVVGFLSSSSETRQSERVLPESGPDQKYLATILGGSSPDDQIQVVAQAVWILSDLNQFFGLNRFSLSIRMDLT